ncbi:hypothetical protein Tco_0032154 [Tanacetum coccineum]
MSSDEASFGVTYTSISSDYEEPSDEPEQAPLSQDYVPGPEYPEYLALSNEEVPVRDQPYVATDSPIAQSPGYIVVSDLEDESDDGPTDYPADEGDDNDSSGDDANDEDEEEASEEDKEEEEEHLASADSTAAASPVVDLVSSAEETEPFKTDESTATPPPPPAYCTTTRMSILAQTPIPFLSEAEVDRLLAIPTPPLSPLTLLSSPLLQIPSPPFLVTFTTTTGLLTLKATWVQGSRDPKRLCISLGPRFEVEESSSSAAARSTRGFRADYGFVGTLDAEIRRDTNREVGYGIIDVWVDPAVAAEKIPPTTLAELSMGIVCGFQPYARFEVMTLRTTVSALQIENGELRAADRTRQTQLLETLTQVRVLQTQIVVLQRQRIEDSDRLTQHIKHEHDRFREFSGNRRWMHQEMLTVLL